MTRPDTAGRTCNLRAGRPVIGRSLRIHRERSLPQKEDGTIACLICTDCVNQFTHRAKHSWNAARRGFTSVGHNVRRTCSAAVFASVAPSLDAMKGSVSASGPMPFVAPKSPRGL